MEFTIADWRYDLLLGSFSRWSLKERRKIRKLAGDRLIKSLWFNCTIWSWSKNIWKIIFLISVIVKVKLRRYILVSIRVVALYICSDLRNSISLYFTTWMAICTTIGPISPNEYFIIPSQFLIRPLNLISIDKI